MKNASLYTIILLWALLFSCSDASKSCLKAAGELDSIQLDVNSFNTIEVYDIFDVYLQQDSNYSIKIRTNKTLLNNVETIVTDSVLTISDKNKCYFLRDYDLKIEVFITAPDIKEMNFYSASSFRSIGELNYENFLFRCYGKMANADFTANCSDHLFVSLWNVTGDFYVHGKSTYLQILNHGSAYIYAFDLQAKYVKIEQRSTGNVEVSPEIKLTATIADIGNIYYKGNPNIDTIITGKGKIIKIE
jgi:hypothetical protein